MDKYFTCAEPRFFTFAEMTYSIPHFLHSPYCAAFIPYFVDKSKRAPHSLQQKW